MEKEKNAKMKKTLKKNFLLQAVINNRQANQTQHGCFLCSWVLSIDVNLCQFKPIDVNLCQFKPIDVKSLENFGWYFVVDVVVYINSLVLLSLLVLLFLFFVDKVIFWW